MILRYAGIDPSMSGMAMSLLEDGELKDLRLLVTKDNINKLGVTGFGSVMRIKEMCSVLYDWLTHWEPDVIAVEEHTYNPKNKKSITSLGMLQFGVLDTISLLDGKFEVLLVRPKTRAKYATGNGNSDKNEVKRAVNSRWIKREIGDIDNDNICDAVALSYIAKDYREDRNFSLPIVSALKIDQVNGVYIARDCVLSKIKKENVKVFTFSAT